MQDPRTVPYVKCNNGSTTLITPDKTAYCYVCVLQAGLTMDARGYGGSHVLRKTVVTRMADLSLAGKPSYVSCSNRALHLIKI